MIYTLKHLIRTSAQDRVCINNKWVPARPLSGPKWETLTDRLRAAWLVFRGKGDVVIWPEGQ